MKAIAHNSEKNSSNTSNSNSNHDTSSNNNNHHHRHHLIARRTTVMSHNNKSGAIRTFRIAIVIIMPTLSLISNSHRKKKTQIHNPSLTNADPPPKPEVL